MPSHATEERVTDDQTRRAERRLDEVLEATGARDPRDFYRRQLLRLKESDPAAYGRAVDAYQKTLIPSIADGDADPLVAWTEYGRTLAELIAPGRTVSIDRTGRSEPYASPPPRDALVLHLPSRSADGAELVALPPELSAAQRATYDWLVANRQTLRG